MLQIAKETSLIDRRDWPDAHRASRRLPEIGHEPGMGIGAQTPAVDLLAVSLQLLFRQPAFEKGARVNARRRMRLEENKVAVVSACLSAKEVIEARFKNLGGGGVARDMATEVAIGLVGANDHGERVPPDDGRDPLLHGDIARKWRLPFERD